MCHDTDALPPAPPGHGAVASREEPVLTAADGNRFAAYDAVPERPTGAGVVILPDIRGLHPYYLALADRFAEAGVQAVAMDFFGRTDGARRRDDLFDYRPAVAQLTPEHVHADAAACVDRLRESGVERVSTVGFCFGGGHSWRLASTDLGIDGSAGLYGRAALLEEVADRVRRPLLMLLAGADHTPPETFLALAGRVRTAGVSVETHVYEGAPHSFFDRACAQYRDACTDAWHRLLAFARPTG
ncbi:dienelactone hydrolase family protein [Rhizomonospora bruguierae]|uniref:dienelactone hydrolase family protein n=1 Tax=Rhizomonospora bruguierae TaxID=1581705 RepID=UPI001BCBA0BA|nr:dienelactone hydrolase family protein [Micromonospora sp. NBRC 107566]